MKYVIYFFVLILLTACQMTNHQKADGFFIANGVKANLLPLKDFKDDITLVQILETNYNGSKQKVNSIVKISPNEMKIIGLADSVRIFTISYKDGSISSQFSPLIPVSKIDPAYIISDIQLIYFPIDAIASKLPSNLKIVEDVQKREIYLDDEKIIVINYSTSDTYSSDIEFQNLERKYSYKITNVEIK